MKKGRVLSGMRPTGKLHLGNLSVLENWVSLQESYECFYMVADWHALTTCFDAPAEIPENTYQMLLDWLSAGLDPFKSVLFVQSQVKEHAELFLLLGMFTPLSWLERCPTYKDQVQQLKAEGKDITNYGFLGYPLLQAADILVYRADTVPVGEDQLPHLEFCREVVRRFNFLYGERVFPEPQAKIARTMLLPGTDGRKMSKSYANQIELDTAPEEVRAKVHLMVTDPARIRKHDPGHPEVCTVHVYHEIYSPEEVAGLEAECRQGKIGCVACKEKLARELVTFLTPFWEKREALAAEPSYVEEVVAAGVARARKEARETMEQVREAMKIREGLWRKTPYLSSLKE